MTNSEQSNQKNSVVNSLKVATDIFDECQAEYRILGSVLIVAHTDKLFRKIGDLDVLLDENKKSIVFEKLIKNGFSLVKKRWASFSWTEAHKEGYLGLTFLLVGKFTERYFSYRFLRIFEFRINADYLRPTEYQFNSIKFVGIPVSSAIAGIRQSFLNPKRKLDQQVLGDEFFKSKIKLYNNMNVYVFGIKLPFIYDIFNWFSNIYGGLRVMFGRKYEPWD